MRIDERGLATDEPYPDAAADRVLALNTFWEIVRKRAEELGVDTADVVDERVIGTVNEALYAVAAALALKEQQLRTELGHWRSGRRVKGIPQVQSVPDGLQYAARLARAQGTEGGPEHDDLLAGAAQRLKGLADVARTQQAELERLRADQRDAASERDQLVEAIGRLVSLPPAAIAEAYGVSYTGRVTP